MHVVASPPDSLSQGSSVLLPHISTLLKYLSGIVRNTERLKKKKFRVQVAKELNILSKLVSYFDEFFCFTVWKMCFSLLKSTCMRFSLSQTNLVFSTVRVSRFVSDKEQSSVLISLLLPYLHKGHNPQVRLTTVQTRLSP